MKRGTENKEHTKVVKCRQNWQAHALIFINVMLQLKSARFEEDCGPTSQ